MLSFVLFRQKRFTHAFLQLFFLLQNQQAGLAKGSGAKEIGQLLFLRRRS
jgi:hypothetical protein